MKQHCAILANQSAFDVETLNVHDGSAPGITLLMGCRKGSRTVEAVAYRFDVAHFSAGQARAWLEQRQVTPQSFAAAEADDSGDGVSFSVPVLAVGEFPGSFDGKPAGVPLTRAELERCRVDTNSLIGDKAFDVVARVESGVPAGGGKLGHAIDQSKAENLFPEEGTAALGHMTRLRWMGDVLVSDWKAVSQKFADCVRRGLWNARSAELLRNWQHPITKKHYPIVMSALAWLGETPPAVPLHEIYGLASSLGSSDAPHGGEGCQVVRIFFESTEGSHESGSPADGVSANNPTDPNAPGSPGADQNADAAQVAAEEKSKMDELEKLKAQVAELAANQAKIEARATQAEEKVELAKKQLVTATLDQARDERRITPAQHEKHSKVALSMSFENATSYVEAIKEMPEAPDSTRPLANQGAAGAVDVNAMTGGQKLTTLAAAYAAANKVSYEQALVKVAKADTTAAAEYARENRLLPAAQMGGM